MIKKGNVMKYFIGNWKMFGIPTSYKIVEKIEKYFKKDIKNNRKYKIIISPPFTLLQDFSKRYPNTKIDFPKRTIIDDIKFKVSLYKGLIKHKLDLY